VRRSRTGTEEKKDISCESKNKKEKDKKERDNEKQNRCSILTKLGLDKTVLMMGDD
jgi:hypothetical protein